MHKAKIFMNGQSQAVRLPKEFRFNTKEVSVTPLGKGIVLQPIYKTWKDVFKELSKLPCDDTFVSPEDLPPQERGWELFK
jgi:antitoxin VapB